MTKYFLTLSFCILLVIDSISIEGWEYRWKDEERDEGQSARRMVVGIVVYGSSGCSLNEP